MEDPSRVTGGVIALGEHWTLNHYGGAGGYLGWLALQTRRHCMDLNGLSDEEASDLGLMIRKMDRLLTRYWQETFAPNDELKRVHVVYFFESVFDVPTTTYHFHLHLIPRTRKLGDLLREYPDRKTGDRRASEINAWRTPWIMTSEFFPQEYARTPQKIQSLMEWLHVHAA